MSRETAAIRANYVAFAGIGVISASWASRIPQVKSQLGLSSSELGLVLLSTAVGSLISLPGAGPLVVRLGSRRTLRCVSMLSALGIVVVAFGARGSVPAVVTGLFLIGFAGGIWDVAVNVQGAAVEQRVDRPMMSRFHAWFGVGTVVGAVVGIVMVAAHVSVTVHLLLLACVLPVAIWPVSGRFLSEGDHLESHEHAAARSHNAWRERRTILIGVIVFAFALTEGSGNDWISVSMIQGHHVAPVLGTLAYALFLAMMTVSRWNGPHLLDRVGRVRSLRLSGAVAIAGLLVFVLTPWAALAYVGVALWGMGTSLGFPVGMSAGADQPALAAPRVGVIASIGYVAYLGGPPLIGLVASWVGLPHALGLVIVPLLPAAAVATFAAPLAAARRESDPEAPAAAAPAFGAPKP
jgi:MFS family permease